MCLFEEKEILDHWLVGKKVRIKNPKNDFDIIKYVGKIGTVSSLDLDTASEWEFNVEFNRKGDQRDYYQFSMEELEVV